MQRMNLTVVLLMQPYQTAEIKAKMLRVVLKKH